MQLLCVGITRYPRAVWDMETSVYPLDNKHRRNDFAAMLNLLYITWSGIGQSDIFRQWTRRRNLLVTLAQYTVTHFRSSSTKSSSGFLSSLIQGHPTTGFCKLSVQRSKYCLEFFVTWGRLKISGLSFLWRSVANKIITTVKICWKHNT